MRKTARPSRRSASSCSIPLPRCARRSRGSRSGRPKAAPSKEKNRMAKALSWKAVRKGKLYCAPACGRGCTYLEYMTATNIAHAMVDRLGKGWKIKVFENMGWHTGIVSPCRRIYVSADFFYGALGGYTAYLS